MSETSKRVLSGRYTGWDAEAVVLAREVEALEKRNVRLEVVVEAARLAAACVDDAAKPWVQLDAALHAFDAGGE